MLDFSFEPYREEMIQTLKDFIKIESVRTEPHLNMPYGKGIFDALMFVQSESERMDLECVNLFGQMAYVEYGFSDEMLAILVHIDVVPKGDGWTMDAFAGIEHDGKIYGRGAIDNKGPAIASLFAIRALSDNCIQLNKKVRLIFGTDEETGWGDMQFYKQHEPEPDIAFSPDGEYPVINTEKGLVHLALSVDYEPSTQGIYIHSFNAGTRPNVVPNSAHCEISAPLELIQKSIGAYTCPKGGVFSAEQAGEFVRINALGKSSHGSRPDDGINAAASLITYLGTLPLANGKLEMSIHKMAEKIGVNYHGEMMDLDLTDDVSGRLTFNLGTVNTADNKLTFELDIRYPVSEQKQAIMDKVAAHLRDFDMRIVHSLPSHHVSEGSELVVKLKEAYSEVTGDEAYCVSIGGATYARAFENAVTFGPLFPGKPSVEHGPDEYIEIETLMLNAEIIANAIIKLCEQTS
ncbi:MAG: Sapep family Mn(2+)-dependent dipeptidase [Clostridia bacterium]|jgi:succinyl-diaminopimelate desuccinylase|nr:Sapep family Mn(2+)-dependent dipeptidase [Clostridia bacterium]MBT7123091.1 Sapep family Mn(2+)-dependent dipeptidase [Clostridia bacterium]